MRIFIVLFALLLALCGVVLFAATLEEVPTQRGMPHPDYSTMQLGGEPSARHGGVLWLGWLYGALAITFFVGLMDVGLRRKGRPGPAAARRTVWILGALFQLVFLAMVLSYRSFMEDPLGGTVLGFPPPSAWMMYGIWGFPMLFIVVYILRFEDWVLGAEDVADFERMVASRIGGQDR